MVKRCGREYSQSRELARGAWRRLVLAGTWKYNIKTALDSIRGVEKSVGKEGIHEQRGAMNM